MERPVTFAVTQMPCTGDRRANIRAAEQLVRQAADQGAQVILLQELFETPYFCQDQKAENFRLASALADNQAVKVFAGLAADLKVVLPISFFEKDGPTYYNTIAMIDADGTVMGTYRKVHIPDGPGYQEKFYFHPGDQGFKVWHTAYGCFGVGICWDQWFPEAARAMVLQGAEALLYPTAIGSEPQDPTLDSRDHWQRVMQGHAAANVVPVLASNRIGSEAGDAGGITFYGSSFISDGTGAKLAEMDRATPGVTCATLDLAALEMQRASWGLFRDRRPGCYKGLSD